MPSFLCSQHRSGCPIRCLPIRWRHRVAVKYRWIVFFFSFRQSLGWVDKLNVKILVSPVDGLATIAVVVVHWLLSRFMYISTANVWRATTIECSSCGGVYSIGTSVLLFVQTAAKRLKSSQTIFICSDNKNWIHIYAYYIRLNGLRSLLPIAHRSLFICIHRFSYLFLQNSKFAFSLCHFKRSGIRPEDIDVCTCMLCSRIAQIACTAVQPHHFFQIDKYATEYTHTRTQSAR